MVVREGGGADIERGARARASGRGGGLVRAGAYRRGGLGLLHTAGRAAKLQTRGGGAGAHRNGGPGLTLIPRGAGCCGAGGGRLLAPRCRGADRRVFVVGAGGV